MKKNIFYTLCLLFLVGNLYSQQTVWVKATASGLADGSSEANAYGSLTTALGQINSATDVLRVVGTVVAGSQNLAKAFAYTIEGDAGGSTLTGVTSATGRMFTINTNTVVGQNVTFKNITFSGQNTALAGGAVLFCNYATTIKFENCIFDGNSLASSVTAGGGALYFTNTVAGITVTITDCTFKNNSSPSIGGAIFSNNANLTITKTTFYNNKTLGTAGTIWGGSALYVGAGTTSVNSLTNCTFYQNTATFPVNVNQDFGAIRTEHGNTTVTNCLFYDNKAAVGNPITSSSPSDWGCSANGTQTFNKSIAQWISNNIDSRTNFISFVKASVDPLEVAANLASSNLTWEDASNKVKFRVAPAGAHTPIAFGYDSVNAVAVDAGAWVCGTRATPTFTPVATICSGATLSALPTTSNNGISGTWSPALDNTTTTTYTFLPGVGECALSTTMTITVTPSTTNNSLTQTQASGSYVWPLNGQTYTVSGSYTYVTECNTATLTFTSGTPASPPTITSLTSNGTTAITQGCGGTTLVITGTNFLGASAVTVNGVAVASYVVDNSTQITATLPAGPIASGVVVVTTTGGPSTTGGNFAVNANVTPTFTQVATICLGASLSALPTTSNNSITGTWSPALNSAATTTYTFTPDAGQCASTATMTITVNASCTKTFTWVGGNNSNDWATAANWTTTGDGPDTFPGQTKTTDIVVISNGGTPVVSSGTYGMISLAINNATGANTGSILTINSGATLTVSNSGVNAITLKGGSIVNNGTLNATSTNVGASFGIACQVPSVAPTSATEYGYSGSGALNINTSASTNPSSGGIQFTGTLANTTYKMLFDGATTFNLNNTNLAVYALRVGDGAKGPVVIGGAGFTLGTVGEPVSYGLLTMGRDGNNVTVNSGTTLTLNSKSTNVANGINVIQTTALSADDTFINRGTIAINGVSAARGIYLSIDNASQTAGTNKIIFQNLGTLNVALAVGGTNFGALAVVGVGSNDGLVTITNSGTMNLSNSQAFSGTSGRPFTIATAASSPTVIFNNSGTLTLSGENVNFGGQPARSTINNTGTITSNAEFQQFTIANASAGTISFVHSGNRQATFTTTAVTAAVGDTYTDANANVFTVRTAASGGTSLVTTVPMTAITTSTGTLIRTSGLGTESFAYTAVALTAGNAIASNCVVSNSGRINTGGGTSLNGLPGLTTIASTSVIAPGGDSGKGAVNLAGTALTINGTLKLQVAGNTTAGVNYDQINNSTASGSFNVTTATLDVTGIYTPDGPVTLDIVRANTTVGSEGTITSPFATVTGLAGSRWSVNYIGGLASTPAVGETPAVAGTAGKVQLVYTPLPTITSLTSNGIETISQGCGGSTLIIIGTNFTGASAVTVNGVAVASYVVDSSTQITAVLPSGATSGTVAVTIAGETVTSAGNFSVLATVTPTFTPVSAICYQGSLSALPTTSTNGITGTWSPALNNTATTEYTFTPDEDQCAASTATTMTIVVNELPTLPSVECNENAVWNPATCQYVITKIISAGTDGTLSLSSAPSESQLFDAITGEDAGGTWTPPGSGFVGVYTYTVIATAPCTGSDTSTVTVTSSTEIPATFPGFCKGNTIATATGSTSLKFYTALTGGTALTSTTALTTKTLFVTETINLVESSPRVARAIVVNNLPATPSALVSNPLAESGLICKYIGSSTPVTFTATATGASSYIWTAPLGATIEPDGAQAFISFEDVSTTPGLIGSVSVRIVDANGCTSLPKELKLTTKVPTAPTALTMTSADTTPLFAGIITPANPSAAPPTAAVTGLVGLNSITAGIKKVGPYMGTSTVFTLTAPAAVTAGSYAWTLPTGVNQLSGGTSNVITVDFADVTPGTAALPIVVQSVGGCGSSTNRTLTLARAIPTAPTALVLTNTTETILSALTKISKVGPYTGTEIPFTLTATPFTTQGSEATSYAWILPAGVNCITENSPTLVNTGTVLVPVMTAAIATEVSTIEVDFNGVEPGITPLSLKVFAVNGSGNSLTRTLALQRSLPTAPTKLLLTDDAISTTAAVTKVGPYTGKATSLTLKATPFLTQGAEATSFSWVLPAGVSVINGATLISENEETGNNTWSGTSSTLTVNLVGIGTGITSIPLSVYAVNGAGTSTTVRTLTLTSVVPATPAIVGSTGTTFSKCVTTTYTATLIPGATYNWTVPGNAPFTGGTGNVIVVDYSNTTLTIGLAVAVTCSATNGTGTSGVKSLTVKRVAGCREASAAIADDFNVIAYPNPSSDVFTLDVQSSDKGATGIQVYDMAGRLIESRQAKSNSVEVGRNYASGIYNVKVNKGAQVKTLRVIKK